MADNVTILDSNGDPKAISGDDISGVLVQRLKMQHGADGSATDVSAGNPLPVDVLASAPLIAALTDLHDDLTDVLAALAGEVPIGDNPIGSVGFDPSLSAVASIFRSLDLDESEEEVKATAGRLLGYYFANLHATAWRYLKFYNATAASVTVGTTAPVLTLPLPPNQAGHLSLAHVPAFATAITVAATTGLADADTGAPGANEVVLNLIYL